VTWLPIVDAKKMEKILLHLGFAAVRQKGSPSSTGMPMVERRRFLIMRDVIDLAR